MTEAPLGELALDPAEIPLARASALTRPVAIETRMSVAGLVQKRARETPARLAAVDGTREVTYGGLAHAVAELRNRLLKHGVRRGDVVGVLAERTVGVPIAFLALESIGAIYLPLEPSWPSARHKQIVADSGVVLILTNLEDVDLPVATLMLDDAAAGRSGESADPGLPDQVDDEEARYVIYTSGTTGKPKGAVVEQRGMVNHLQAKIADLGLAEDDRLAFSAPIGFDISIWQMLCAFVVGGVLVVMDEETVRFPRRLVHALRQHAVSVVELVPTVAGWIASECSRGIAPPPRLRWLLTTGEEIQVKLAASLLDVLPDAGLLNAYGPTECSDDVTHHVVTAADTEKDRIPVGTPVPNAVLYLLAADGSRWRAARSGEVAELFVGGVVVGRGYLGEPALTADAFFHDVLDPGSPTGRLYRTGDLVRLDDGVLTYLARADRQVKVAGVRMELDEIEAVLTRHGAVDECAVVLDEGSSRVSAWVVGSKASAEELRDHARAWLPASAVPTKWNFVTALPRTHNGKADYESMRVAAAHS
jgi:D-alanine--poly(phosphoribitol) ligase subunit 1